MKQITRFLCLLVISLLPLVAIGKITEKDILHSFYTLNKKALTLGQEAKGNLQDMQIKSYNGRLIEDHKVMFNALEDLARQLEISLPQKNQHRNEKANIPQRSKEFDKDYLETSISLHGEIIKKLEEEWVPSAESAHLKKFLKNFRSRLDTLYENAEKLDPQTKSHEGL